MATRGTCCTTQWTSQPHPVFVGVGVEVAVEQRLERRSRGHGLGETALSRLAVLQGPVPHRGQRRVGRICGRIWMQHISPAVDGRVALPEVLSIAEVGGVIYYENVCFLESTSSYSSSSSSSLQSSGESVSICCSN